MTYLPKLSRSFIQTRSIFGLRNVQSQINHTVVLLKRGSISVFVITHIVMHLAAYFGKQATIFVGFGNKTNKLGLFGGDFHRAISMVEELKKARKLCDGASFHALLWEPCPPPPCLWVHREIGQFTIILDRHG